MSDELQTIAHEASADAVHQAKNAQQAVEVAREAQMVSAVAVAVKQAFNIDDEEGRQKRFVDVSRVPLICQAIVGIDQRLKAIEANLTWGIRLVVGAVILALIYVVLPK